MISLPWRSLYLHDQRHHHRYDHDPRIGRGGICDIGRPPPHEAVDGTGWVRESLDGESLTHTGQIFRIAMYHDNVDRPEKNYEMANKVVVFDRPHAIAWEPGQDAAGDGKLSFGGWIWRYDIHDAGPSEAEITLTYDWSAVPPELRQHIQFPPFDAAHLENSLKHLSDLAAGAPNSSET